MTTRMCVCFVAAAALVWTGLPGQAAAGGSAIADSMGDLRWGMSEGEVAAHARRMLGEQYAEQLKKADSAKQAKLRGELKQAQAAVEKSRVEFEGTQSRWDSSPIAGEFSYGNSESMLIARDPGASGAHHYYFFREGRLWKWYKAVDQKSVGTGGFKKFASALEGKFGKGRSKKGELNPKLGETQWVEYLDRNSRLRGADNSKRGVYALIFEDMSVVRELAAARPAKTSHADEEPASAPATKSAKVSKNESEVASAATKRSVFTNERRDEGESDFQARKEREVSEARERQARARARKEDAKQGEVLKQLDGIDDKDPLGGL